MKKKVYPNTLCSNHLGLRRLSLKLSLIAGKELIAFWSNAATGTQSAYCHDIGLLYATPGGPLQQYMKHAGSIHLFLKLALKVPNVMIWFIVCDFWWSVAAICEAYRIYSPLLLRLPPGKSWHMLFP